MTNTGCVARVGRAGPEGGDGLFVSNDITPRKDSVSLVDKEPAGVLMPRETGEFSFWKAKLLAGNNICSRTTRGPEMGLVPLL